MNGEQEVKLNESRAAKGVERSTGENAWTDGASQTLQFKESARIAGTSLFLPLFFLAVLFLTVFFLGGCDSSSRTQSAIDTYNLNKKETLTVAMSRFPQSLDWNFSNDLSSAVIETNIMDGLTAFESAGAEVNVVPALSDKWDISNGGLKYTFHVREGVKWSDGQPLRAREFVDSLQRLLASDSNQGEMLSMIKNAKQFHEHKIKDFSQVGVKAPDDNTLIFTLDQPTSYFPALFADHSTFPIRKDLIEKYQDGWSTKENLVTLGAYWIAGADQGKFLILRRNENYFLKQPLLKNVVCRFGLKASEELKLFGAGQLQAIINIPKSELKSFKDREDLFYSPLMDVAYLAFNVKRKPLSNPILRRAIAMSIDREDLAQSLLGAIKPLSGMVPPGLVGYESNRGMRFDPDAAKELLKHSGFSNLQKYGPFFLKVAGAADPASGFSLAAENIKKQLENTLGLSVKIADPITMIPDDAPTLVLSHRLADFPDPGDFLELFTSLSRDNVTGWKNRDYDQFVKQASETSSVDSREKLYARAQHILTEREMPVVPLFVNTQYCLLQRRVRHFPLNALGLIPFKGVTLE